MYIEAVNFFIFFTKSASELYVCLCVSALPHQSITFILSSFSYIILLEVDDHGLILMTGDIKILCTQRYYVVKHIPYFAMSMEKEQLVTSFQDRMTYCLYKVFITKNCQRMQN